MSNLAHKQWTWVGMDTILLWCEINYESKNLYSIDPKYCCLKP